MGMRSDSTLVRRTDGKRFRVTLLSHWSDIEAEDGERDRVKWVGDEQYVSDVRGHGYLLEARL